MLGGVGEWRIRIKWGGRRRRGKIKKKKNYKKFILKKFWGGAAPLHLPLEGGKTDSVQFEKSIVISKF